MHKLDRYYRKLETDKNENLESFIRPRTISNLIFAETLLIFWIKTKSHLNFESGLIVFSVT